MRRRGTGSISKFKGRFLAQKWIAGSRFSLGVHDTMEQAEQALSGENALHTRSTVENRTPPSHSERAIYFVRQGTRGPVKIGSTKDIRKRMLDLQSMNGTILTLLALVPGRKADELELHRRFAAAQIHGEWFRPTPELLHHVSILRATGSCLLHRSKMAQVPEMIVGAAFET